MNWEEIKDLAIPARIFGSTPGFDGMAAGSVAEIIMAEVLSCQSPTRQLSSVTKVVKKYSDCICFFGWTKKKRSVSGCPNTLEEPALVLHLTLRHSCGNSSRVSYCLSCDLDTLIQLPYRNLRTRSFQDCNQWKTQKIKIKNKNRERWSECSLGLILRFYCYSGILADAKYGRSATPSLICIHSAHL